MYKLKLTANWTGKQCKLSIFLDENTFLLPELKEKYVWYPCVTPYIIKTLIILFDIARKCCLQTLYKMVGYFS